MQLILIQKLINFINQSNNIFDLVLKVEKIDIKIRHKFGVFFSLQKYNCINMKDNK